MLAQLFEGLFHTTEMLYLFHFPRDIAVELIFSLFVVLVLFCVVFFQEINKQFELI